MHQDKPEPVGVVAFEGVVDSDLLAVARQAMKRRRDLDEINAAIFAIDAGESVHLTAGKVHIRLSPEGREAVVAAIYLDLINHRREIAEELRWRDV